ncbi:protein kinase [Elusimicrobiota bacterium]
MTDPMIGKELGGCRLTEKLGSGGMGVVYKGHHIRLDRVVVVKVLHAALSADSEYIEGFDREARAAAKLEHPRIVQVYDQGHDGELYFIIMQFIDGEDLEARVKREGSLLPLKAVPIIKAALEGLAEAHKQGIVHRDVKPSNILLGKDGTIRLSDFGLAVQASQSAEKMVYGTPMYMAPEQAWGAQVDQRADIYAMGVTLFHILAGKAPFDFRTAADARGTDLDAPPPDVREINPEVSRLAAKVTQKMMAKRPDQRHQSVQEVLKDLDVPGVVFDEATIEGERMIDLGAISKSSSAVIPSPEIDVTRPLGGGDAPPAGQKPPTPGQPKAPTPGQPKAPTPGQPKAPAPGQPKAPPLPAPQPGAQAPAAAGQPPPSPAQPIPSPQPAPAPQPEKPPGPPADEKLDSPTDLLEDEPVQKPARGWRRPLIGTGLLLAAMLVSYAGGIFGYAIIAIMALVLGVGAMVAGPRGLGPLTGIVLFVGIVSLHAGARFGSQGLFDPIGWKLQLLPFAVYCMGHAMWLAARSRNHEADTPGMFVAAIIMVATLYVCAVPVEAPWSVILKRVMAQQDVLPLAGVSLGAALLAVLSFRFAAQGAGRILPLPLILVAGLAMYSSGAIRSYSPQAGQRRAATVRAMKAPAGRLVKRLGKGQGLLPLGATACLLALLPFWIRREED